MRTPRPWLLPTRPTTRAQLTAAGVTKAMLATQLKSGRLLRLRHDVYLAASEWPDDPVGQHLALVRAESVATPGAAISHESAALVWGLPSPGFRDWEDSPVSLTVASGGRHRRLEGAIHHLGPLPSPHLSTDTLGYTVTSPARTAIDLAKGRPLPEALVLLDATARLTVTAFVVSPTRATYRNPRLVQAVRELLTHTAEVRGIASLKVAIGLADPCRESAVESLSAGHIFQAGLPMPVFQERIQTRRGVFYPDCYWPEQGVIGEVDGAVKYRQADAFVKEKEREQILRDHGYRVVRWLGKEIMATPQVVVERINRKLEAA
ncbi:MAG: DUF559 domain-containing protein [Propionicimonas sp.]